MDNFERVREVIADITQNPFEKITESSTSGNVEGWDDEAQVNIIVALEMDLGISFDPGEALSLTSVRRIMQALRVQEAA